MNLSRYSWPCRVKSSKDIDPNLPWTSLNKPLVFTEISTFDMLAFATSISGRTKTRVRDLTVILVSVFSFLTGNTEIKKIRDLYNTRI